MNNFLLESYKSTLETTTTKQQQHNTTGKMTIYTATFRIEVAELVNDGRIIGMIDNATDQFVSIHDLVLEDDGAITGTMEKRYCGGEGDYLSYYGMMNIEPLQTVKSVDYLYFIDENREVVNLRQFIMEKYGDYDVCLEAGAEKEEEEQEEEQEEKQQEQKEEDVVPIPPSKLMRGFNNMDHDYIHKVLRMWIQENDPEYVKRDDDVTDGLYKTSQQIDWYDLGVVRSGPSDYNVDTLDGFISTLSLTKQVFYPESDPFYYNDPTRFEFSKRQAAMIYETMMKK
jgi:hypothetical protein